jgi:hypothetical protein
MQTVMDYMTSAESTSAALFIDLMMESNHLDLDSDNDSLDVDEPGAGNSNANCWVYQW